jgi:hypothetical protein
MPDSDLAKYKLDKAEWDASKVIKDLLSVSLYRSFIPSENGIGAILRNCTKM